MGVNRYNTTSMKTCADKIDAELKKYESYRNEIDRIISTLDQNWDDDLNKRYVIKYKQEFAPVAKKLEQSMKQYADILYQCAKKYGAVIDNGNSRFLSS